MDKREILYGILMKRDVVKSINYNLLYITKIIPEIKPMFRFAQNHPRHHLDVWNHTLLALSYSKEDFDVRLSLLLHDIGKPFSFQDGDDGIRHFKGHPSKSAIIAENILNRLGFDEDYIKKICYLVKNHDNPITFNDIAKNKELEKLRFEIQRCDNLAHNPVYVMDKLEYFLKIEKYFENENECE